MNISSILIKTRPENVEDVMQSISVFSWLDVHFSDGKGRIIVTVEGEDVSEETERIKELEQVPKIVSIDMVNHYFDEEEDVNQL